jgi:uncharacterized membrane protein YqiK
MDPLTIGIGIAIVVSLFVVKRFKPTLVKVEQGNAIVRSRAVSVPIMGPKGVDVFFNGVYVIEAFDVWEFMDISVKTIEIDRRGRDGLICKDNIRADISVSFYVRVLPEKDSVTKVAGTVGCERASDIQTLNKLFNAKFSEALKTAGKKLEFEQLYTRRDDFRDAIIEVIGKDLNGYHLEDAAIDYLEQTPLESLDPENILDAEGITKITDRTATQHVATNKLRRAAEKEVKREDTEAREVILELERQEKDKEAEQARLVATKIAEEQSATRVSQAEEMAKSEEARIKAQEKIEIEQENKEREVEVAKKNRERVIAVETERVEKDRDLEAIQREREVELRRIEKEREIEVERKNIQEVIAERVAVEKNVAQEEERIKELRLLEEARRNKEAKLITAQANAEEDAIKAIRDAEAAEIVARSNAKARLTKVEAELEAAEREAQSKIRLAEGVQAEEAASGLAQARVKEAMASADEKEGMAKARVMEAQAPAEEALGMSKVNVQRAQFETHAEGTRQKMTAEAEGTQAKLSAEAEGSRLKAHAEAEGIAKKAEAMKQLSDATQAHEEFRLKLDMEKEVALHRIDAEKEIAEAQAMVLGEAFKSANIDIIGGDGPMVDKIFQAATFGKSLDTFANGGKVAGSLVNGYANGSRSLAGDIKDVLSNVKSEDVRNLSLAKLLGKMSEDSSGAERVKLKKVLDTVTNMGLSDLMLNSIDTNGN